MLLLVDLDGTVWRGREPVPGVARVLADRATAGDVIAYVTNNSMHHRAAYIERLEALGAPVSLDRIVTSARATALYLADRRPAPTRVLVLGSDGLVDEVRDVGIQPVTAADAAERVRADGAEPFEAAGRPEIVIVGLDRSVDYARIAVASACIRAGAAFVATNRDPVFPGERGLQPGAGAIVAAIEVASGVAPLSIGKPAPYLLVAAARAAGTPLDAAVMIGDSLHTDIPAAHAAGIRSVLLLTGVTTQAHLDEVDPDLRPTAVATNAAELAAVLAAL